MFKYIIHGTVGSQDSIRIREHGGSKVASFSVAAKETIGMTNYRGEERPCPRGWVQSYNGRNWERTIWITVTAWGRDAEKVEKYIKQGMQVYVEGIPNGVTEDGKMNPRVWQANDGSWRASYEVTARELYYSNGRGNNGSPTTGAGYVGEAPPFFDEQEDELPF